MRAFLKDKKGSANILFIGMSFCLACIVILVMEIGATFERYDYAMDVLQRCCNSAVEENILDEYRKDKILKMDCASAEATFYRYLNDDMPDSYQVVIESIESTEMPPVMTVIGKVTFETTFSTFGFNDVTYDFKVRATNYDLH